MAIFYFARRAPKLRYYGDVIHPFYWKSTVEHDGGVIQCVIVYLARDIRSFVMYCVNGKPRLSLLIESTDSMILSPRYSPVCNVLRLQWTYRDSVLSSDARLHVNPIYFLARRAVC